MNEEQNLPCAEKLVFNTKKEAETASTVLKFQKGTKLKSYLCRHCDLWHLATKS